MRPVAVVRLIARKREKRRRAVFRTVLVDGERKEGRNTRADKSEMTMIQSIIDIGRARGSWEDLGRLG